MLVPRLLMVFISQTPPPTPQSTGPIQLTSLSNRHPELSILTLVDPTPHPIYLVYIPLLAFTFTVQTRPFRAVSRLYSDCSDGFLSWSFEKSESLQRSINRCCHHSLLPSRCHLLPGCVIPAVSPTQHFCPGHCSLAKSCYNTFVPESAW